MARTPMPPSPEWLHRAVFANYAERDALTRPDRPRVWSYTGGLSHAPGDRVALHVCTTEAAFDLTVWRDGADRTVVLPRQSRPGHWHDTPGDASVRGCGWPMTLEIETGADWPSGAYVVETRVPGDVHHHLFILRPAPGPRAGRVLMVAASGTWTAYNDWGGSNSYQGFTGPDGDRFSPVLSLLRPFARGFVTLPDDAPRAVLQSPPPPGTAPRYPHMEWALANGYSKKYMSSGWAAFDRHFFRWAEGRGYGVDLIAQTDLHYHPEILDGYAVAAMVGHDEYWSSPMRDAIDAYVEGGGRVARFAGNFLWQVRLEDEGRTQVCWKYLAAAEDPLRHTALVTSAWEDPLVGRPGALTFGLNATRGMYAGWSGCSPRGARGFPVYRPEHWAFAGSGLYYGDILGAESAIFGYEVDGIDHEIRGGLPWPTDPLPGLDDFQILALGLAATVEEGPTIRPGEAFLGTEDGELIARLRTGRDDAAALEATKRGSGCVVHFRKGRGEVFHAGTSDWVAGLMRRDPMVEIVTANVLNRFLAP
jgi:hypothetical protein